MVETLGLLSIPPLAIAFNRSLLNDQTFLSNLTPCSHLPSAFWRCSTLYVFYLKYTFVPDRFYFIAFLHTFVGLVLGLCYLALIIYMKTKAIGAEKKRMFY